MILFIDPASVSRARLITEARDTPDVRRYYLVPASGRPDAIVVCRNGLALASLASRRVDASIGWDTAQPGFCAEADIGRRRTKVTIYRSVTQRRRAMALGEIVSRETQNRRPNP